MTHGSSLRPFRVMRTASYPQEIWKTWTPTSSWSPKLKAHRSSVKSLKRCKTNSLVLKGEVISKGIVGEQKLKIFLKHVEKDWVIYSHFNVDVVSCWSFQTLAELAPEWHLSTNSDGAFFRRSRIQEDLLVVLDPRIRTHGSNLCSLIVAGNRYLFISPLRGCVDKNKGNVFWRLRAEYFGHCLAKMSMMVFACRPDEIYN